jgi:hypothetical protein
VVFCPNGATEAGFDGGGGTSGTALVRRARARTFDQSLGPADLAADAGWSTSRTAAPAWGADQLANSASRSSVDFVATTMKSA